MRRILMLGAVFGRWWSDVTERGLLLVVENGGRAVVDVDVNMPREVVELRAELLEGDAGKEVVPIVWRLCLRDCGSRKTSDGWKYRSDRSSSDVRLDVLDHSVMAGVQPRIGRL